MFNLLFNFHHILLVLLLLIIYKSSRLAYLKYLYLNCKVKEQVGEKLRDTNNYQINIITPKSVNYHFTRKCNYVCGFCFHTAKTSSMLHLPDAKKGLEMLKAAGNEIILSRNNSSLEHTVRPRIGSFLIKKFAYHGLLTTVLKPVVKYTNIHFTIVYSGNVKCAIFFSEKLVRNYLSCSKIKDIFK